MKKIITRENLKETLRRWQTGELTARDVNNWADSIYPNDDVDYEDWDKEEKHSVTNEVLAALDCMDMNLMTAKDIPAYLLFLDTPKNEFEKGYSELQKYLRGININERQKQLVDDDFYAPFYKKKS